MCEDSAVSGLDRVPGELVQAFIDNPYECPVLIDENGIVQFLSRYNSLGFSPDQAVGKHIAEIIPQTRLPRVLKTGRAEIGEPQEMHGEQEMIISRIPLKDKEGKVIGALGRLIFNDPKKIIAIYHRLEILKAQVKYYQSEIASLKGGSYVLDRIIGESSMMKEAKKLTLQAAVSNAPVLITGESGTGKELFAEAIHQNSYRAKGPFIKVNCAAIPHDLIESELFGYEGGAFTGARRNGKPGRFELAQGGSIFLDEIGDMPIQMQAKLLRVVQEHEFERVGGTKSLNLDFRIIAATNQNLQAMIEKGTFRKDLFYRLNVFVIQTPQLRDIPEDIPRIAQYFLGQFRKEQHRQNPVHISQRTLGLLQHYPWPGNVRELRNLIERAMNIADGEEITVGDLPKEFFHKGEKVSHAGYLPEARREAEKRLIMEALQSAKGNKVRAAEILGIHRTGLYQKMKRYGVTF